jgi:hypothetical protein
MIFLKVRLKSMKVILEADARDGVAEELQEKSRCLAF